MDRKINTAANSISCQFGFDRKETIAKVLANVVVAHVYFSARALAMRLHSVSAKKSPVTVSKRIVTATAVQAVATTRHLCRSWATKAWRRSACSWADSMGMTA